MVNIKHVAKLAGVSIGTVSNVLTGNRPVSDELRQRVLSAAEELNYQPNLVASSLVTGRTKTIGAVMTDFQLGLEEFLAGMNSGVREDGFSLLISSLGEEEDPGKHIQELIGRKVDGIIWVFPETEQNHRWFATQNISLNIPIVFTFGAPIQNQSSVQVDNFSGGYSATRHLLSVHGCKKIGHISGPRDSFEVKDRKAGWEKALLEEGIEPEIVCECDWYAEGAEKCTLEMLEKHPDIDGLFAANDLCALVAIKTLLKINRKVPDDVKVIGFDNVSYLENISPSLTSVCQDFFGMGYESAKEIQRRIQYPEASGNHILLPTQLIIRQSCGCNLDLKG